MRPEFDIKKLGPPSIVYLDFDLPPLVSGPLDFDFVGLFLDIIDCSLCILEML